MKRIGFDKNIEFLPSFDKFQSTVNQRVMFLKFFNQEVSCDMRFSKEELKSCKENYILDRSVIDVFVQNDFMWEWPLKNRLLKYLLKDIDEVHLLYVDPLIIYERKQELPVSEIGLQLDKFKDIVSLLKKGKCIDNTLPIDDVVKELSNDK